MQGQAQSQAYAAQMEHRNEVAKAAQTKLNNDVFNQQVSLNSEIEKASQAGFDNARRANEARSTARAQASARGVTGISLASLVGNIELQDEEFSNTLGRNVMKASLDTKANLRNAKFGAEQTLASVPIPERPNGFSTVLGIGNAVIGGATSYMRSLPKAGTTFGGGGVKVASGGYGIIPGYTQNGVGIKS